MPNHVRNILTVISGTPDMKTVREDVAIRDEEGKPVPGTIDFERIKPMPPEIFRGPLGEVEMKQYGKNNWYDWSIRNWGTKWNAYDFGDGGEQSIVFSTAWGTPDKAMVALSEKYPKATFRVFYADEMLGENCGEYTLTGGRIEKDLVPDTEAARIQLGLMVWDLVPMDVGLVPSADGGSFLSADEAYPVARLGDTPVLLCEEPIPEGDRPAPLRYTAFVEGEDEISGAEGPVPAAVLSVQPVTRPMHLERTDKQGTRGDRSNGDLDPGGPDLGDGPGPAELTP